MQNLYWTPKEISPNLSGFQKLYSETIGRGLCSACGACVSACPNKALAMKRAEPDPILVGECNPNCDICSRVCPGNYIPKTKLEEKVLGRTSSKEDGMFGIYRSTYVCQAADQEIAARGMGGGVCTGLLNYGLESGELDCAIVTGWDKNEPWKPAPVIATTRQKLIDCAISKYSPSQNLIALREAADRGFKKIAIMALPCQAIALRKMQLHGLKIAMNVKLIIGLYCMAVTYIEGIEHIIRDRLGVPLENVERITWRDDQLNTTVWTKDGDEVSIEMVPLFGSIPKAYIGFRLQRCMVCLDHLAELADISVGAPMRLDVMMEAMAGAGSSGVFIRTERGEEFLKKAAEAGHMTTRDAKSPENTMEEVYISMNPGTSVKKWGNPLTIKYRQKYGQPVPRVD